MKIFVDENIPLLTVQTLRDAGHDVVDIRGSADQGVSDSHLWDRCRREGRLLITTDMGFSRRRAEPHDGVLIVRLKQPNRQKIHERVMMAMSQTPTAKWQNSTLIMQDRVKRVWHYRRSEYH